nr:T9SS type A sorting domain-containing protein [Bacteroidota bacterium]
GKTAFEDMELIIYPNPVKDHVGININSVENTLGDFLIMDMIGKAMIRKTEMIRAGNNQIDIHAANLSEGMYILNMTIGDKLISKKLVK